MKVFVKILLLISAIVTVILFPILIDRANVTDHFDEKTDKPHESLNSTVIRMIGYIDKFNVTNSVAIAQETFKWANHYQVDPLVLVAIQRTESTFNKNAVSSSGAVGLMQVMPKWHSEKIGDANPYDIETNIFVGAKIFKDCLRKHVKKSNPTHHALMCYHGEGKPGSYAYAVKVRQFMSEI